MGRFSRAVEACVVIAGAAVVINITLVAGTALAAPRAHRDDTTAVCTATAKTVSEGLDRFVADMAAVSDSAGQGDLVAAEAAVRSGGADLVDIAAKLRSDGANADDSALKGTVAELAAEFEHLGRSLDNLSALQTFDASALDGLASRMSQHCRGVTPPPTTGGPTQGSSQNPSQGSDTTPGPTRGTPDPRPEPRVHDW